MDVLIFRLDNEQAKYFPM